MDLSHDPQSQDSWAALGSAHHLFLIFLGYLEETGRLHPETVIIIKAIKLNLPFSLHPEDSFDISYNRFKLSCQLIRSFMCSFCWGLFV